MNILVVDDSQTARMFTKRCLEIAGCRGATFFEAQNGKAAMETIKEKTMDLVVTDLVMPEMDGAQLVKQLKENSQFQSIPVIVISSLKNSATEQDLLRQGVRAVLGKPISPATILKAVKPLIEEWKTKGI